MKKDGYAESTIKSTSKRLRMMNRRGVNLDDPVHADVICDTCDRYLKYNELEWQRARYQRDDQPPYVPTEEEAEIHIANSGPKYALLLSLIRDTGMRPIEVERAKVKLFELERGSVNVQTAKHG